MPIVEAVATMVNAGEMSQEGPVGDRVRRIEKAMAQAVSDCYAKGVTDPEKVRAAILEARDAELAK